MASRVNDFCRFAERSSPLREKVRRGQKPILRGISYQTIEQLLIQYGEVGLAPLLIRRMTDYGTAVSRVQWCWRRRQNPLEPWRL
jgi:hypothetical protein